MEWIAQLQGKVVGLDTAPLIYFMEQNPKYIELMRLFFRSFDRGDFRMVTSTVFGKERGDCGIYAKELK